MKKLTFLAVALFAFALLSSTAHAATLPDLTLDTGIGTAPTYVDYVSQGTFGWDELPTLYYEVDPATSGAFTSFWWENVSTGASLTLTDPASGGSGYLTPDASDWNNVKDAGTWVIKGYYDFVVPTDPTHQVAPTIETLCATTTFVVTPEPVSMVLFGLGGLPLAAGLISRKKIA